MGAVFQVHLKLLFLQLQLIQKHHIIPQIHRFRITSYNVCYTKLLREDVGKTTLMENLITNVGKVEHNGTTVAIDYGRIEMDDKKFHFFGTPGQERFGFMREIARLTSYNVCYTKLLRLLKGRQTGE